MYTRGIRMLRKSTAQIRKEDFTIEEIELPPLTSGQVFTRTRFLSLDPYLCNAMRTWTGESGWDSGRVIGRSLAEVIDSADDTLQAGDWVLGSGGWQELDIRPANQLQRIDPDGLPASAYLGVLGSSGLTAWIGINRVLRPQTGETVVISSAAGTVGGIAGQLAKLAGSRVIGIAGGREKCKFVTEELGFDDCIDHTAKDFSAMLAAAAAGCEALFENVGAKTLDPLLAAMKPHGRIALCGLIAHIQDDDPVSLQHFRELLMKGISLQGFRVMDYPEDHNIALQQLRADLKAGNIHFRETISHGLESAPAAYAAMLFGGGIGKHLVAM